MTGPGQPRAGRGATLATLAALAAARALAAPATADARPSPDGGAAPSGPAGSAPPAPAPGDPQLADPLARTASDPRVPGADPAARGRARALMAEGVRRLQARDLEHALAYFLEAYGIFPSAKLLLNIGSTLRDMGRAADAANTYQRYLDDPTIVAPPPGGPDPDRVREVRALLAELDGGLTRLEVVVSPRGADVSIDGGPFVPVEQELLTRVAPGLHLLRVRKGDRASELTIHGFVGETKRVEARAPTDAATDGAAGGPAAARPAPAAGGAAAPAPGGAPTPPPAEPPGPARVSPWLTNGALYAADRVDGPARRVRAGASGAVLRPSVAGFFLEDDAGEIAARTQAPRPRITSGAHALLRVDGKLRGVAAGLGLAVSRGRLEGDLLILRSAETGAYLGARVRLLTGTVRPYLGGGVPTFLYDDLGATKIAVGVRGAAGLELFINAHLSIQADVGYERFFGVEDTMFESSVVVPTVGVIGRL